MRFERKYRISEITPETIASLVRNHPAGFTIAFPDRRVHNIYYDTQELKAFYENVHGVNRRIKYRIRWYGENKYEIIAPKIEMKIKRNTLGEKKAKSINTFSFENLINTSQEVNAFAAEPYHLHPVLTNSYLRSYYLSADGLFRITIDRQLQYNSMLATLSSPGATIDDPAVILEIKYDEAQDVKSGEILQYLPFRHTKSSKYVTGVELTI